ncbi:hypothetical protein D3C87_151470 [compost metagenome]
MKLPKNRIIITLVLSFSQSVFGQQEPRSAFFWNNYIHTNPAMTGAVYKHHANAQWRNQWTKINGAPTTLWLNYAMKLDSINSGVGVSYEYDVIGLNKSHTALLSYAYHIPIKKMFLSLGASAGLKTLRFDASKLVFSTPEPQYTTRNYDPVFQCDFGIALHSEKWNVGVSMTQLNGAQFDDDDFPYKNRAHLWVFADYTFGLGENWKLTPRLQSYSDGKNSVCSSLALLATWKDRLWFGATASVPSKGGTYNVGPMIGYDIAGKFRLAYAYEFWISSYNTSSSIANNGSHEILLSYQLK